MNITKLLIALGLTACSVQADEQTLNLDLSHVSVSGLSSGAYMANQFHLAHSDWVNKVGIIAGGPYYCAKGNIKTALEQCVNQAHSPIDNGALLDQASAYAKAGKIAPLEHLKNARVWLLHGSQDTRVAAAVSQALYQQYVQLSGAEQVHFNTELNAAHLFPTLDYGTECQQSASPYIGACQFDAAGEMLTFLYGELQARASTPTGKLLELDQQRLGGQAASSLADQGYAYVPASCAEGQPCSLHISFHGCNQNAQSVGREYVQHTGLNNWADSNHMVVLYPQTKNSTLMPLNPQGCWDWWGYTDGDYATKDGQQIQAVSQMARALANYSVN